MELITPRTIAQVTAHALQQDIPNLTTTVTHLPHDHTYIPATIANIHHPNLNNHQITIYFGLANAVISYKWTTTHHYHNPNYYHTLKWAIHHRIHGHQPNCPCHHTQPLFGSSHGDPVPPGQPTTNPPYQ